MDSNWLMAVHSMGEGVGTPTGKGNTRRMTAEDRKLIRRMHRRGIDKSRIAEETGFHQASIRRFLNGGRSKKVAA